MDANTGKYIALAGGALMLLGLVIYFGHDKLHWMGRLPGDIRIEKESYRFYFPFTTLLLLSLLLTLFIHLLKRFL